MKLHRSTTTAFIIGVTVASFAITVPPTVEAQYMGQGPVSAPCSGSRSATGGTSGTSPGTSPSVPPIW